MAAPLLLLRLPLTRLASQVHHLIGSWLCAFVCGMPRFRVYTALTLVAEVTTPLLIHNRILDFARMRNAGARSLISAFNAVGLGNNALLTLLFVSIRGPGFVIVTRALATTDFALVTEAPFYLGEITVGMLISITALNVWWCVLVLRRAALKLGLLPPKAAKGGKKS